jgi:RecG-like helicase
MDGYESISDFPLQIMHSIVHGKNENRWKGEFGNAAFHQRKKQIMVATTVIEVV